VIGGTSLFGGEGNVIATLIGAIIETTIRNGLNILGVNAFWQYVVNGGVIIAAVGNRSIEEGCLSTTADNGSFSIEVIWRTDRLGQG